MLVAYYCLEFHVPFFLGPFEKLRKATISCVMSVCPHGTTSSHWTDVDEMLYLNFFSEICRENLSFIKI
jgi:hypothetical protein